MPIRPTTGHLLRMRATRPMRGVCISTMAMSTATVSPTTTMSDVFEADSEPR